MPKTLPEDAKVMSCGGCRCLLATESEIRRSRLSRVEQVADYVKDGARRVPLCSACVKDMKATGRDAS